MALTAIVNNTGSRVVAKVGTGGTIQTNTPVTLKNTTLITRLDQCTDVDATNEQDGDVLVYNAALDKYIVKPLDLTTMSIQLDGGSF